jgi:hypothetical protein
MDQQRNTQKCASTTAGPSPLPPTRKVLVNNAQPPDYRAGRSCRFCVTQARSGRTHHVHAEDIGTVERSGLSRLSKHPSPIRLMASASHSHPRHSIASNSESGGGDHALNGVRAS